MCASCQGFQRKSFRLHVHLSQLKICAPCPLAIDWSGIIDRDCIRFAYVAFGAATTWRWRDKASYKGKLRNLPPGRDRRRRVRPWGSWAPAAGPVALGQGPAVQPVVLLLAASLPFSLTYLRNITLRMVSSTGVCFLFLVSFLQFCRFFCVFLSFYIILGRKGVETNHPSSTWTATRLGEQCEGSYFRRASYTWTKRHLAAGSETQNSPRWNWTVNFPWWVDIDWGIIWNCK